MVTLNAILAAGRCHLLAGRETSVCYSQKTNFIMSYDLMVFDSHACPRDRAGFLEWYQRQVEWSEDHSYDNDAMTTSPLRAWFSEMREIFPPVNGPYKMEDLDNPKATEYSIGHHFIYVSFAWSEAENACRKMFRIAEKHRVGFFDVSAADGGVWMPDSSSEYYCVHGTS